MAELRLIELAQQGDPQAIAALMNQSLQPKGMTATVERQGNALEVTLEADRVPNRQALTAFVEKGIHNLGIESIRSIRIMGQQTGASFPAWMQELYLEVSPADLLGDVPNQSITEAGSLADASGASQFSEETIAPSLEPDFPESDFAEGMASPSAASEPLPDLLFPEASDVQGLAGSDLSAALEGLSETPLPPSSNQADLEAELGAIWDEQAQDQSNDLLQDLFADSDATRSESDLDQFSAELDVSPDPAAPSALDDLSSLQDLFADESIETKLPDRSPDPVLTDPWEDLPQADAAGSDRPAAGMIDDLFADSPNDPATTDEMEFEAAAVPLTSVDDLLAALDGEEDTGMSADEGGRSEIGDSSDESADAFEAAFGETQNPDDAPDSTTVLVDLFSVDVSAENGEPLFTEEVILIEETIVFDSSDDFAGDELVGNDASEDVSVDFGAGNEAAMLDLFSEDAFSEDAAPEIQPDEAAIADLFSEAAAPEEIAPPETADDALDRALFGSDDFEAGIFEAGIDQGNDPGMSEADFAIDEMGLLQTDDNFAFPAQEEGDRAIDDPAMPPGLSSAIDENLFMVASEPLDFDSLEFGISESEALDANLIDELGFEPGFESESESNFDPNLESTSESLDFLDEMATEAEMLPEVMLQDQWIESSPSEESLAGELGLEGFAPEEFTTASEQDVLAQEFPTGSDPIDFPTDFFPAETPAESVGSQFPTAGIEESAATAEPFADFGEAGDLEASNSDVGDSDVNNSDVSDRNNNDNLDLTDWFADQIDSGDPAAELSTAPSEDFLIHEDMPNFGFSGEASSEAAADALFNDVPPEPSFTPEADLLEELTFEETSEDPSENASAEFAPLEFAPSDIEPEPAQPEITQEQLEAQIENLFAEEEDSVTEDSFQNSWELASDDVSDDSADIAAWGSPLDLDLGEPADLEEPALPDFAEQSSFPEDLTNADLILEPLVPEYSEEIIASDSVLDDAPSTAETVLPDLSFEDEVTIVEHDLADNDLPDLAVLTDMPDIDLPDDQVISSHEDPFAADLAGFDAALPEMATDDADTSLANTLSLSEAIDPDQLVNDLQGDDLQRDDLQDNPLELSLGFQNSLNQEDYGDLTTLEEPSLLEELTDEQLQELLGNQPEDVAPNDFALDNPALDNPVLDDPSEDPVLQQSFSEPFADFNPEPVSETPADLSDPVSASPENEPLLDFLNRQFGLEEELSPVEEPELSSEPVADREILAETEFLDRSENAHQPTQIPFAATPFAAASMASSDVPAAVEPNLDLSDDWLDDTSPAMPAHSETAPAIGADDSEWQEQSQEDLERQLESSDFVQPVPNEVYPPAEPSAAPPRVVVSSSPSRPASSSTGIFTLILFSIVGFIAALLGFSLWSELSAPPEPQPQPVPAPTDPPASPVAPPTAPTAPPAAPAVPPVQTAPPTAPVAPPADAPAAPPPAPADAPVAPPPVAPVVTPEASPVPPAAPVAPPADAPAPPAAPASP
ncbi:hypothetical protein NDI45_01590 [Leptolyngbya sp. GB1-A1]|uniref:hypothetical protein n=1 Tax=Leptolyngbya sp. GB1-A1 TaxID=2933908 RepID=UPI003298FB2B